MPTSRTRLSLFALIIPAAVLGALLAVGVAGSQSAVCGWCHSAERTYRSSGPHASAQCYDCHLPNGVWSLPGQKAREIGTMYVGFVLGKRPSGAVTETSSRACLSCHARILQQTSEAKGLRINHSVSAVSASCDSCHARVVHGSAVRWARPLVMDECIACHQQKRASTQCSACHVGKASVPRDGAPWQATHGRNWKTMHGVGDLASCSSCHPKDFCVKCHGMPLPHDAAFGAEHGTLALKQRTDCLVCHKTSGFCDACHGLPMPHPAGFLKAHSKVAKSTDDASCYRCHAAADCATCHSYHVHPGNAAPPARLGLDKR